MQESGKIFMEMKTTNLGDFLLMSGSGGQMVQKVGVQSQWAYSGAKLAVSLSSLSTEGDKRMQAEEMRKILAAFIENCPTHFKMSVIRYTSFSHHNVITCVFN